MARSTALGYNTGSTITGTIEIGDLAVVTATTANPSLSPNGVKFWMGPDEELGYVIGIPVSAGTQSTPVVGVNASVGFIRSSALTENSFVGLVNDVFNQTFTGGSQSKTYLNNNGYWTSYNFLNVEYLVLGGGGSVAQNNASHGGGGAGGYVTGTSSLDLSTTYTVTVGAGGARRTGTGPQLPGFTGNPSSFSGSTLIAQALGGGPTDDGINTAGDGASGGGGVVFSSSARPGGAGISGQGKNGGAGCTSAVCGNRYAGGGGGAGVVGSAGTTGKAGNGGNGIQTSISGTPIYFAGGGGGNSYGAGGTNGTGGLGGGGNGSVGTAAGGTDGQANRGGGAGGGAGANTSQAAGGSGIVIIRYLGSTQLATGGTVSISSGYVIHSFTGSGTFVT